MNELNMRRMRNATRITVATFSALAGWHRAWLGEVMQGNRAPGGIVITSWPDAEPFRILAGEPAMTLVPGMRATGILAILVSLLFLVWATMFMQRTRGAHERPAAPPIAGARG